MNKSLFLLTALAVCAASSIAAIYLDDGASHYIGDGDYSGDDIHLDSNADNGTRAYLTNGCAVGLLNAHKNAKVNVGKGAHSASVYAYDAADVTMSGGDTDFLYAHDNAIVTLSGGKVNQDLGVYKNGKIFLAGTGFMVNGQLLSNGDKLSDLDLEQHPTNGYFFGDIFGTLADGSMMYNRFYINNTDDYAGTGDIVIVPEPATMLLIAFGGLIARRKKA